jgi:hypothetical protein
MDGRKPDSPEMLKGTCSRDLDRLSVIWMDRALFGDEPKIFFYLLN